MNNILPKEMAYPCVKTCPFWAPEIHLWYTLSHEIQLISRYHTIKLITSFHFMKTEIKFYPSVAFFKVRQYRLIDSVG